MRSDREGSDAAHADATGPDANGPDASRADAAGADAARADATGPDAPSVVARLTWQVPEPAALVADLRGRLDLRARPIPTVGGIFRLLLDGTMLEIVPWQHERADDVPQPGGRLVLEPIGADLPGAPEPPASDTGLALAGIGWGTVDLARAVQELGPWLLDAGTGPDERSWRREGVDPHLGARTWVRVTNGLPGEVFVLAEPTTEGRLAASLARHGEGPVALYLRPKVALDEWVATARGRRVNVSARRDGPLGPQVLLPLATSSGSPGGGRGAGVGSGATGVSSSIAMAGPHLIVVGGRSTSSEVAADGTIRA